MILTRIYTGPVTVGQVIRFKLNGLGNVSITNLDTDSGICRLNLLGYRKALADGDDFDSKPTSNFMELTPTNELSDNANIMSLTKGYYALRVMEGSNLSVELVQLGVSDSDDKDLATDRRMGKVLTQYRESPKLLATIRAYLEEIDEVKEALCAIPDAFDIDVAIGNSLTVVGRWLGFPRCHDVPSSVPVFGFECTGFTSQYNIKGFCENALWLGCPGISSAQVCINDDDIYRRFLYVRRYQLLGKNDYLSFQTCIETLFGSGATFSITGMLITVNPNRTLSSLELTFLKIYERVLPSAVSVQIEIQQ